MMNTFFDTTTRCAAWALAACLHGPLMAQPARPAVQSSPSSSDQAKAVRVSEVLKSAVANHERGRWSTAQRQFESLSQAGVAAADHNLAVMHLKRQSRGNGAALGDAKRDRLARLYMLRAAEGGFVTAQYELAQMLDQGLAGPRDFSGALTWYERAALAGSADAQVAMGTAHYLGRGTARNATAALDWYLLAARQGDVGAQYMVASMAQTGDGLAPDFHLARYWFAAAAANGDLAAAAQVKAIDQQQQKAAPAPTKTPL